MNGTSITIKQYDVITIVNRVSKVRFYLSKFKDNFSVILGILIMVFSQIVGFSCLLSLSTNS